MDLVTGAAGFIGRHLVQTLTAQGRRVRGLDLLAKPPEARADWVQGSLLDPAVLDRALVGVTRVFHLAAIPHFWTRERDAHRLVNLEGTKAVVAAARRAGVAKLVHCSTEAILLPESEGQTIDGCRQPSLAAMPGPYTRSKLLAEEVALAAHDLAAVAVNPTAPIGPGDNALTPPMRMLQDLLQGRYPAYLDCTLNLVDVRDVAQGHLLAADHGKPGQRYLLGGENLRLSTLLQCLGALSGKPMPKRQVPAWLALASAHIGSWLADNLTGRPPPATPEAVRLALAAAPLSSALAETEIGYRARPLDQALADAIADLAKRGTGPRRGAAQA
ncbi:MAG: NAD-dependent epimerase/dehydratase family protein [Rhodospirillales bacterium]